MIILGISLLRLGDLILQKPLIEGLRRKHPHCEIHLLVNSQFSQVEFLFAGIVDKFIYFDRETFQKSCGEKEYNIFWGFHQLKTFVEEVNQTNYEYVYNFTHNRLTAHLAGLIKAKHRIGIYTVQGQFYGLNTAWIQFFNNFFGKPEAMGFHYTEILARALSIPLIAGYSSARKTKGKKLILIQPLTSDLKKNWLLEKYQILVDTFEQETEFRVEVLGAPFEEVRLRKIFSDKNLKICDLSEAALRLQEASLLITGDTSIKHLAALAEVPLLELSLGSSQPLQVGAYSNNAVVLQPHTFCGPCPHSQNCSQPSHLCGDTLKPEMVFEAARIMLGIKAEPWDEFCQRHSDLNVLKTEIRAAFGWTVQSLSLVQRNYFEQIMHKKTMIVEEIDRRHLSLKGAPYEQRTGKLSLGGAEAP